MSSAAAMEAPDAYGGMLKREWLEKRHTELKQDRRTWEKPIEDIGRNVAPYRVMLDNRQHSDHNRGDRKDHDIINSRPLRAHSTCVAGLSAGMTSAARPWLNLVSADRALRKLPATRRYLDDVKQIMLEVLVGSNFYEVTGNDGYPDMTAFGNAALLMEEDAKSVVHFTACRFGTYWIARNSRGEVDTFFWRRPYTVRQLVEDFGLDNCSKLVRERWKQKRLNDQFFVIRAIYPNRERVEGAFDRTGMAFASCWWEESNPNKRQFLREAGYYSFPVLVPAWSRTGDDTYARGPGWEALGHCKELQYDEQEIRRMKDLSGKPPTVVKGNIEAANLLPGGMTEVGVEEHADVKPLFLLHPNSITVTREEIDRHERAIDEAFYVNLFLAVLRDAERGGARPTATEVQAMKVEIMLMLGPLLQSVEVSFLRPLVRRLYEILDRNNWIPEPPDELLQSGRGFEVEFISILHTAQQASASGGLRAFVGEILAAAQINPEVFDKVNVDAICEQFAKMYGVSPEVIRTTPEVKKLRDSRAQAQQAAEEGQAMLAATQGAANLSKVEPGKVREVAAELGAGMSPIAAAQLPQ